HIAIDFNGINYAHVDQIVFTNCANGAFVDTRWTDVRFIDGNAGGAHNLDVDDCSGLNIVVSGDSSSPGYGAAFEKDTTGVLTWVNGDSATCTWSGALDTTWTDPGNWDDCDNDRGGYPDHLDFVIVPSGGNQPT